MTPRPPTRWPVEIHLADQSQTEALARSIAARLAPGDLIALSGGLGAGKTTFARALIRALAGDAELEVPSPTFTLVQAYGEARIPVTHYDLYRLRDPAELIELGFDDAPGSGVTIVEWPDRAGGRLPRTALAIQFRFAGDGRIATLSGPEEWSGRLFPEPNGRD